MKIVKIVKGFVFVLLMACMPLAASADSVDLSNQGGTITASGGNTLTLSSTLSGVSGLGIYGCGNGLNACSGTVTFTTGGTFSGSLMSDASWTGGSITIKGTGPGGAFTFTGSFSNVTWTLNNPGPNAFWVFVATIGSGTLTDSLGTFTALPGAKIDLTELGMPVNGVWGEGSGNTTLTVPDGDIPQVPELGTLTLVGGGLVGLGVFARRRLSKKTIT
jgi:hypothetical protein